MLDTTIRMLAVGSLLSFGAMARAKPTAMPDQVQCTDGTIGTAGRGACSHHGGIARSTQSAPTQGAANRALPPTERAPDNSASKSPWSIFGGKRKDPAPAQSGNAQSAPPRSARNAPVANPQDLPAQDIPAPQGRTVPMARSPRQSNAPATAAPMAKCRDGSVSYSAHHSGTCSGHGGVAQWLDAR